MLRALLLASLVTAALAGCTSTAPVAPPAGSPPPPLTVLSPDGTLRVDVTLGARGVPYYAVTRNGQALLRPSRLGVVLAGGDTLGMAMRVADFSEATRDTTWTQPWGEVAQIRDHHAELRLTLEETSPARRQMEIVFRVFDDGVGLRYAWPAQPNLGAFEIWDELTEFRFAAAPTAWWIPAYGRERYEYLYEHTPLGEMAEAVHTPLTLEIPGGPVVALHEAALVDYASMALKRTGPATLEADLIPWSTGVRVYGEAPFASPWRTLLVGDTPGDLVTNYVVLNLNAPNALGDVSWVEPGKYVGIWWAMHLGQWTWNSGPRHGATTEHTRRYIDFAADYGFDGVLVEGWNVGWDGTWAGDGRDFSFTQPYPDFDLEGLAAYARDKGVYLIGHHETGGNMPRYDAEMDAGFALYEKLGVRSVKSGYVQWGRHFPRLTAEGDTAREWNMGQYGVRHYQRSVDAAARHHTMLNIHESIKDTGLRRTYPNLMSREAARGQEYNSPQGGGNGVDHVPTLVFTRMLAGPMDFTPGIFDLAAAGDSANHVPSTLAGQLALYVVLYSPVQMAADLPENYLPYLDAFQFIRDVPADWADTRVLEGAIGDHATIVRRDRDSADWYLGAVTDGTARTVDVPLDFLAPGRTYEAQIYRDGDGADWQTNPMAYVIEARRVTAADRLTVGLASGGGLAVRFRAL